VPPLPVPAPEEEAPEEAAPEPEEATRAEEAAEEGYDDKGVAISTTQKAQTSAAEERQLELTVPLNVDDLVTRFTAVPVDKVKIKTAQVAKDKAKAKVEAKVQLNTVAKAAAQHKMVAAQLVAAQHLIAVKQAAARKLAAGPAQDAANVELQRLRSGIGPMMVAAAKANEEPMVAKAAVEHKMVAAAEHNAQLPETEKAAVAPSAAFKELRDEIAVKQAAARKLAAGPAQDAANVELHRLRSGIGPMMVAAAKANEEPKAKAAL
jgi:hypothetical protein